MSKDNMEELQRWDLAVDMERPAEDGEWVRFSDVQARIEELAEKFDAYPGTKWAAEYVRSLLDSGEQECPERDEHGNLTEAALDEIRANCTDPLCSRMGDKCVGYHCSVCGGRCNMMGHHDCAGPSHAAAYRQGREDGRKELEAWIEAEAVDRETRADEIEVFYPAKGKTLRRHAEVIRSLLSGPMKKGGE